MAESTDTSSGKRRLLVVLAAVAAALAIAVVVVVVVDDGREPAAEEAGGETNGDALEFGSGQDRDSEGDDGPNVSRILESEHPLRRARKKGVPIIRLNPKQAKEGGGGQREVQKLLEELKKKKRK